MSNRARSVRRRLLRAATWPRVPRDKSAAPFGAASRGLAPDLGPAPAPATELLYGRLRSEDIDEIVDRLGDEHRQEFNAASTLDRHRLALAYGLAYGVGSVAERTGLTDTTPPAGIHSMFRGIEETGGAYYYADLVLEWLGAVGQSLQSGDRALDFSCSSGRVVRVLAAGLPDVHWHGCDPNGDAVRWAGKNIAGVDFFQSALSPPLKFEPASLDLAYAVSVWSHYSASAALSWLEEMHRVIRPGGHLLLTTHGLHSCVWFSRIRDRGFDARLGSQWLASTMERLQRDGHCFWRVFGPDGDEGVRDAEWGLAFFTAEWLSERVTPAWSVAMYRIGRAAGNQDVFALRRN